MKTSKPDKNAIVAKSNVLIEKATNFDLSEHRLLAYCLSHYDSRSPENRTIRASVEGLADLFPMDRNGAYTVVRRNILGISQKPLEIQDGKRRRLCHWFSAFDYIEGEGAFEFHIAPEIRPYLLGLEHSFTRYYLESARQFKSANTWKMYENLKRWQAKGTWSVELDKLRQLLGLAGKYPRWNSFCQCVTEPTTKEINAHSDLDISYTQEKRGRRIVALTFIIKSKPPEGTIDVETPQYGLYRGLMDCRIKHATAMKYARDAEKYGKAQHALDKLPDVIGRWPKKGPLQAYVLAAMSDEIYQMKLDETKKKPKQSKATSQRNNALAVEATACYESGQCAPTDSDKCRICRELFPSK